MMTQDYNLSLFKNKRDNQPQLVRRTWQELCELFFKPQIRSAKDGTLFSPATFEPALRRKENVRELSLLVLDIDHNAELEALKKKLTALGSAFAIYSTHSHLRRNESNPNAEPRFRVCLPLAVPIPAKDFPALWQYIKQTTGLPLDESAKDTSRMFYTPAIAAENAPYIFHNKDGAALNWRNLPLNDFSSNGNQTDRTCANNPTISDTQKSQSLIEFEFHEDRHFELCKRIEAQGKATGRGGYEMKCPAHNGNGNSSLFYHPEKQTVACIKKPNPCSYFDILVAFDLPNGHLPSREYSEKHKSEFEEIETKIRPFPVPSEKCFYGLAGDFVRLIEPHTEASPMALLAQFLVYFGNIVGRSANYKVEGDKHFTNLFCILVGKTAQGRKGTSFGRVKQVFKGIDAHHEKECLTSGLASGEGLLYQIRDAVQSEKKDKNTGRTETIVTDNGISDKRLLIIEGEFAQVLRVQGREGNTLSSFIRNLWDTGTARSLTKTSPLRTTDAHVSIIGHITQTELLITLSEVESANGYANRFLYIAVERAGFLPFGSEIPAWELGRLQDRVLAAIEFSRQKGQLNFSIEASKIWAASYQRLETSRFGYLAKVTQRASPYVLRLSLIFALLDQSPLIEKQHLEAALSVWQYSEDSARYIFGERLDDHIADKILKALRENENDGLTRTEIRDLFDRNAKKPDIDTALQYLFEARLASFEKQPTKGKPKEVWFVIANDINDQNDQSLEMNKSLVVNVVNVVSETDKKQSVIKECPTCEKELEKTSNGHLFCPMCLSSY